MYVHVKAKWINNNLELQINILHKMNYHQYTMDAANNSQLLCYVYMSNVVRWSGSSYSNCSRFYFNAAQTDDHKVFIQTTGIKSIVLS